MIDDYKPNSNKSRELVDKENEKRAEKVVSGTVITKKQSGWEKFKNNFISDDSKNIGSYVMNDVLIPATKKAISDIVTDGIDILLYGETGRRGKSSSRGVADRVSYRSYYDDPAPSRYNNSVVRDYSYNDIILATRGEAEEVLTRMDEIMDKYGLVRVADLYDLVGITGNFTDNKYGWTNIRNANIVRVRDGYQIKMPRAIPID